MKIIYLPLLLISLIILLSAVLYALVYFPGEYIPPLNNPSKDCVRINISDKIITNNNDYIVLNEENYAYKVDSKRVFDEIRVGRINFIEFNKSYSSAQSISKVCKAW
jgi:hypothetical protein